MFTFLYYLVHTHLLPVSRQNGNDGPQAYLASLYLGALLLVKAIQHLNRTLSNSFIRTYKALSL